MRFFHSIQGEWIKRRRSAVSWLTLIGSFFIPAIILITRLINHNETLMVNSSAGVWMRLFNQNWQFMSIFLLPMGIILAASLIAQIEYRNNAWKQVFTSPQNLSTIFWAKYLVILIILLQFFILFNIGIYLTVAIPSLIYSNVPYPIESIPFQQVIKSNLYFFICCLPVLGLQYLLSLHIKNFMVSIGIGLALLIASLIASGWHFGYIIPYVYCSLQFLSGNDNQISSDINIRSWAIGYFIIFTGLNYLLFVLKSQSHFSVFFSKVFKNKKYNLALFSLFGIIVVGVICIIGNKPQDKPLLFSKAEVEQRIKNVEQNLGAFSVPGGNKDWTLEERMKYYKIPGLSIAVIHNYKLEWAKGYGLADINEQKRVDENTIFIPGSLSKSVNAFGILRLAQEKKIDLFTDINQYLTSWKFLYNSVSKNKKITVANLLSHTAGLSAHGFYGYRSGDSLPTIYQILNGKKPANSEAVCSICEPGVKMEYSGGGVMISQLIAMDVSKLPYDKFMNEKVLKPIGMEHSFYTQPLPIEKRPFAASGYDSLGNEIKGKYPIIMEQATGGLWTTPSDICKFILEIQLSLKEKSNKVLSKETVELMLTPYLNEQTSLGFFIENNQGHKYFGHSAGNPGFSGTFYGSMEDGNGLAIFINSENSDILSEITNSIIETYNWKGFDKKESKNIISVQDSILQKYVGTYTAREHGKEVKIKIFKKDNNYWCSAENQNRKMYFTTNTDFFNMEVPSSNKITFDKKNKVVGFTVSYLGRSFPYTKISDY